MFFEGVEAFIVRRKRTVVVCSECSRKRIGTVSGRNTVGNPRPHLLSAKGSQIATRQRSCHPVSGFQALPMQMSVILGALGNPWGLLGAFPGLVLRLLRLAGRHLDLQIAQSASLDLLGVPPRMLQLEPDA